MRRLLVAVCAIAALAFAPQAHAAKITGGLKAGGNFGDLGGSDAPDNPKMRSAFQGGGFLEGQINERLGLRGEVLYVQKGVEGDYLTDDGDIHTALYKLDYVDIPVVFVTNFPAGGKFAFTVFAGPSFNFNLSAKAAVEERTIDLENVKSFEFGAVIGGGATYALSKFSLLADVRYSMGATSVSDDVQGQSVDVKNRGIGVMGGISFPIGAQK
jgi:Outer membrane protein beta-barrel domain